MQTNPILKVEALTKKFDGIPALRDTSFELLAGEVHSLTGENGAGKSTFIRILSGLHRGDGGRLLIDGNEVWIRTPGDAQKLGIAVIYQDFDLAPNLSIADNLLLGREPAGLFGFINRREQQRLAARCLERVGLEQDTDTLVENLSVARRQLVAIARAISVNARILVMDEPTSALASDEIENLLQLIVKLKETGTSVLYISHKLDEVFRISDRITVFRDGETIGTRTVAETSAQEIISMMVGRDLKDLYTKTSHVQDDVLLEAKGIQKHGIFNNTDFSLRPGEILGFYGLKGAGRSEMMGTLFGLDSPDEGEILLEGKTVRIRSPADAIRNGIGYVPEDRMVRGLFPNMNAGENMTISAVDKLNRLGFIDRQGERKTAADYISRLKIRMTGMGQMISALSGGNQQKIILARWLINDPKVLILDEPTAGIDVGAKSEIYELIDQLAARGMGIILISSELPEILGMADRILVMHAGKIVGEFSREEATEEILMHAIQSEE